MVVIIIVIEPIYTQVLFMSNNNVKDWGEFQKLAELPALEILLFVGERNYWL